MHGKGSGAIIVFKTFVILSVIFNEAGEVLGIEDNNK